MSHFLYTLEFLLLSLNIYAFLLLDRGGKRGFLSEQRTHPLGEIVGQRRLSRLLIFIFFEKKIVRNSYPAYRCISLFLLLLLD
jgi:hypothetical protein